MTSIHQQFVDFRRMTKAQIAEIHAVDARTVHRWCGLGMPRNADGSFDAAETIAWRANNTHDGLVSPQQVY